MPSIPISSNMHPLFLYHSQNRRYREPPKLQSPNIMKICYTWLALLQVLALAEAACQKDACYNHVVSQSARGPNQSRRLADCRSILKTVVDDATTTVLSYTTGPVVTSLTTSTSTFALSTTTTTTLVEPSNDPQKRQINLRGDNILDNVLELEARDTIVIKGDKPDYATSCKSNQDFGKHHHILNVFFSIFLYAQPFCLIKHVSRHEIWHKD